MNRRKFVLGSGACAFIRGFPLAGRALALLVGLLAATGLAASCPVAAFLSDYVFLVRGLLAVHGATEDERWLELAGDVQLVIHAMALRPTFYDLLPPAGEDTHD